MRKFRINYVTKINGEVAHRSKVVKAYTHTSAKATVSQYLFDRDILHVIRGTFFEFPATTVPAEPTGDAD